MEKKFKFSYDKLNFEHYSSEELEEFGRILCSIVNTHIGLLRYDSSGIVKFDFTSLEIGKLLDITPALILGISFYSNRETLLNNLNNLLIEIGSYDSTFLKKNSVKKSLQKATIKEINKFQDNVKYNTFKHW